METLAKADIFFFITSIFVILLTIAVVWGAFYVIRILRNVKDMSEDAREETRRVVEDISDLRHDLKQEGVRFIDKIGVLGKFIKKASHKRRLIHRTHEKEDK
jgi:hypothetical protein